jgi:hypothetical protein
MKYLILALIVTVPLTGVIAYGQGYTNGAKDNRSPPISISDKAMEALSDLVGKSNRSLLFNARLALINFLAGNSEIILNTRFTQDHDSLLKVVPLNPGTYGAFVNNIIVDRLASPSSVHKYLLSLDTLPNSQADAYFKENLAAAKKAHPLTARARKTMVEICRRQSISGTMIDAEIDGHHYDWIECP